MFSPLVTRKSPNYSKHPTLVTQRDNAVLKTTPQGAQ